MTSAPGPDWLHFDVHGLVGVRVEVAAPAALQLSTMLASFAVDHEVPADLVVSRESELMVDAALVEDELAYTDTSVQFKREHVQVVRHGEAFAVHGAGELLTTLLPLLDVLAARRGAAMIHAATVSYHGRAVALPAAGGTGKTSTIAKLMKRPGYGFMGDDWGFVTEDGRLLNYEKPMFIKPHHRPIYPHLFQGARKPLVPTLLSRPVGHLTTLVHPHIVKHARLADASRRWSPEHRIVTASQALPGVTVTGQAPLLLSVFVERHEGARTTLVERDMAWMVERMIGNFHIEMPAFSRYVVAGMAATSHLSVGDFLAQKAAVLTRALDGVPTYSLMVPSVYSPDVASDDIVHAVHDLTTGLLGEKDNGASVA